MEIVKEGIVFCAALLLFASLLPVRRLLFQLPSGASRRGWLWLSGLLLLMIACSLSYALGHQASWSVAEELVVPSLLLCGSWFIFLVSQLSASGIDAARRLSVLEHQCITDGLTGIFNRRYFDQQLRVEQQRTRRHDWPLSLMLIDIDHFKQFNDRYGHQAGDHVLQRVCHLVNSLSRTSDVVARYGGEEIAVIVPGADMAKAVAQAERLRGIMAGTEFDLGCNEAVQVTISIGVTQAHALDVGQPDALVGRADKALYMAKERGRNRVEQLSERRACARVTHMHDWMDNHKKGRAA